MIKSVCFLTTYRCNARCTYCECGPNRREMLSLAEMTKYIDDACRLGTVHQVIFSGGEPSLLGDDLFRAIEHARNRGLCTRVVTNGRWGGSEWKADLFVKRLQTAGLNEINISIDDLHQEWIPVATVKRAFLACYANGMKNLVALKVSRKATLTAESLSRLFGVDLIEYDTNKKYTAEEELRLVSTGCIVPVGRRPSPDRPVGLWYGPFHNNCASILKDIVIGADHQLLPCCGIVSKGIAELRLGDLRMRSLIALLEEANEDLILNWLALEGPLGIKSFVEKKAGRPFLGKRFVNICHLCDRVLTNRRARRIIVEHLPEIKAHVSIHREYFESIRSEPDLIANYLSP